MFQKHLESVTVTANSISAGKLVAESFAEPLVALSASNGDVEISSAYAGSTIAITIDSSATPTVYLSLSDSFPIGGRVRAVVVGVTGTDIVEFNGITLNGVISEANVASSVTAAMFNGTTAAVGDHLEIIKVSRTLAIVSGTGLAVGSLSD